MGISINGHTSLYGIIGYPVSHSLSPRMHNTLFDYYKLNCVYLPFPVKPEDLERAIKGFECIGVKGLNVTVPHKEKVIKYLDRVDDQARLAGAVNTIKFEEGNIYGFNTDISGFSASLKEKGIEVKGKKVAVLGAGGAARAVVTSLHAEGVGQVYVMNRTLERAITLSDYFFRETGLKIEPHSLESDVILKSDIVINTTSVGMAGKEDRSPVEEEKIKSNHTVIDIIYNPPRTPLLKIAENKGCLTLNGLGMLIYQGIFSFKIWTGIEAESAIIYSIFNCNNNC